MLLECRSSCWTVLGTHETRLYDGGFLLAAELGERVQRFVDAEVERRHILETLARNHGNRTATAAELGCRSGAGHRRQSGPCRYLQSA